MIRILICTVCLFVMGMTMGQDKAIELTEPSQKMSQLNSPADENNLALHPDGRLIFSRKNFPDNQGGIANPADLWIAKADSAISVGVDTMRLNSPVGFVNGDQYLIYSSVRFATGAYFTELYMTPFEEAPLAKGQKLEVKYMRNKSQHFSGSVSADGRHMVMAMESNTSYGVEDLYVTHLQPNGEWSSPKNLGYSINTSVQEYTPFLAADNKTMIFSTNGRGGYGSFDLFITERLDDTWQNWSEPQNLGEFVNTAGADLSFAFLPGDEYGYFVSTTDSDGYGDIRRVKITADIEDLTDSVEVELPAVAEANKTASKVIQLVSKSDGNVVNGAFQLITDSTTIEVSSPYALETSTPGDLEVEVHLEGYMTGAFAITAREFEFGDTVNIVIDPLVVGATIQLNHVLFYQGTANMIEGSQKELDNVVEVMQRSPKMRIQLKGHTDNQGDPQLNLELSKERVRVVQDYILKQGIDHRRLSTKAFGGNQPLHPNDTEENRKLNRRVEFTIVEN